jgi:hypothetical protein
MNGFKFQTIHLPIIKIPIMVVIMYYYKIRRTLTLNFKGMSYTLIALQNIDHTSNPIFGDQKITF